MARKELVVLVGMQGAGKTYYCRTILPAHVRLSQDEGPRRFETLLARYLQLLDEGTEKIVIDRTNPSAVQRTQFIQPARERGYHTKIVYFDLPRKLCMERILERGEHPTLETAKAAHAMTTYLSRLDVPRSDECDVLEVIRS